MTAVGKRMGRRDYTRQASEKAFDCVQRFASGLLGAAQVDLSGGHVGVQAIFSIAVLLEGAE
jgi:hypothetical protein